jgi:DNA-binding beta-propeller fold protein YncE
MQKTQAKADLMNPFIGPRPFSQDTQDQRLFFGRDRETDEIASLIFRHQLVLVYAQSGAGKTSIFNAKVIPKLKENGFDVLPVARVGGAIPIPSDSSSSSDSNILSTSNVYLLNAFQTLIPTTDRRMVTDESLSSFVKNSFPPKSNDRGKLMPQVIIFDQFEEIFSFYPNERWQEQRQEFFEQIGKALENNPLLRIVFLIREDYLAQLDPFLHLLPERLRPRFRLERLRREAAKKAIKGPFDISGSSLDDYVIEKLLDNLLNIQIETPAGKRREVKGEFIEPIHLQVVCQRLWQKSVHSSNISLNDLEIIGDVDKALEDFYEDAIHRASEDTGPNSAKPNQGARIYEGDIRIWCEKKLITSTGTRGIVHRGPRLTSGIPNVVIDSLENNYLIRGEWKSGAKWYELTHDRLIKPVLDSNRRWKNNFQTKLIRKKRQRSKILIISIAAFVALYTILVMSILSPGNLSQDEGVVNVAVNPNTNMVYVTATNGSDRVVSIIDGTTNQIVRHIPVDYDSTSAIAVNPNTNMVYAASDSENTISIIDGTTNQIVGHVEINGHSGDIAIDPIHNRIYAGKVSPNEPIAIIDGDKNVIVDHIGIGYVTESIVNPNTNMVYAASKYENTISIINGTTNQIVGHIPALDYNERSAIAVNHNTNTIYVTATNGSDRVVSIVDGTTHELIANRFW